MGEPYVGEIRIFAGSFAPAGWAFCAGQLMPISQNDTLFNLIGTTYGGDGQETFGIPDLQGRVPVHQGQGPGISQNYQMGEKDGVESVTITANSMPLHNHAFMASTAVGNSTLPTGNIPGQSAQTTFYALGSPITNMFATAISQVGGNQPHENMQPYLVLSFIISLFGVFPTQN
jgi:microcystin-dependent protein